MSKLTLVFVVIVAILIFSILTVFELWALKEIGFDVLAHFKATIDDGDNTKIVFEALGATAFIIGQPIILTKLFVWGVKELAPLMIKNAVSNFVQNFFQV